MNAPNRNFNLPPIMVTTVSNGPFARYVKLLVVHPPGIPATFPPPPRVTDPDMHAGINN